MTGFYWANVVEPEFLAQPSDLADFMGVTVDGLPANVTAILRSCTSLVLSATQGAFYDADPATGLPLVETDDFTGQPNTQILDAMTRATCIQSAAWITLGVDPFAGGVYVQGGVKGTTKIGTASVTRDPADTAATVAARQAAIESLVPDAVRVLQHHNLVGNGPWTFG